MVCIDTKEVEENGAPKINAFWKKNVFFKCVRNLNKLCDYISYSK